MAEVIIDERLGDYAVWRLGEEVTSSMGFGIPLPRGVGAIIEERGDPHHDVHVGAFIGMLAKFGGLPHDSLKEMETFLATQGLEVVEGTSCMDAALQVWCRARKKEKSDEGSGRGEGDESSDQG